MLCTDMSRQLDNTFLRVTPRERSRSLTLPPMCPKPKVRSARTCHSNDKLREGHAGGLPSQTKPNEIVYPNMTERFWDLKEQIRVIVVALFVREESHISPTNDPRSIVMREIPPLSALCLRVVGSHSCSAETTFAKDGKGEPSAASRLLRSFHQRSVLVEGLERQPTGKLESDDYDDKNKNEDSTGQQKKEPHRPLQGGAPMRRTPCIGQGSARRTQANEVDLHHPFAGCKVQPDAGTNLVLVMEYGNPAMDCLQCYIDALVELGRMDDTRLGRHFFEEWRANVLISATGECSNTASSGDADATLDDQSDLPPTPRTPSKKRRRTLPTKQSSASSTTTPRAASLAPSILGSLSLHNCTISTETTAAMQESQMGPFLAVLDLSGVGGLTDTMLENFLPQCTQLQRLSLKNCRRVTQKGVAVLVKHQASTLMNLDIGGVYNVKVDPLVESLELLPKLEELHASGLGWTDDSVGKLTELHPQQWKALSLSYSLQLSQTALRQALLPVAESLQSISLAFCESVVDNALMGMLGRNLPQIQYLDVRGNSSLTTLTGWYDGRVSADLVKSQTLIVLGRYSGLSEASVEETRRVHPMESADLIVILDGTGTGLGIMNVLS